MSAVLTERSSVALDTYVVDIAWSPDGRAAAVAGGEGAVLLVEDVSEKARARVLGEHAMGAIAVAWQPGTKVVASSGQDSSVALWDTAQASELKRVRPGMAWTERIAWSPDGKLLAAATGRLAELPPLSWHDEAAVTVVVAAHGYPGTVRSGDPVTGIADAERLDGVHVLHAGTALDGDGRLVTAGGRVLSVVGRGSDLQAARAAAYAGVERISFDGAHHRTDIAEAAANGDWHTEGGLA